MNTTDMPSNGLTKYQPADFALVCLLDNGKLILGQDLINPSPAKRLLLSEFELALALSPNILMASKTKQIHSST